MDKIILSKIEARASETGMDFLGKLVNDLSEAKKKLSSLKGISKYEQKDLRDKIDDAMAASAFIIMEKPDGTCALSQKEIKSLAR